MPTLQFENLQAPVRCQFDLFLNEYKRLSGKDRTPLLNEVEEYLAQTPGKQLRPLLLLLSAKACCNLKNSHCLLAAAMELLHNATLMHDDVVDESDSRRNHPSVRGRWGNQVAVLCGDYFLTKVMDCLDVIDDHNIRSLVTRTVTTMCEGELKQLNAISTGAIDVDSYLDIIGSKTASLMALCCQLGANPENRQQSSALHDFGYHYGILFQLRDDLASCDPLHDASLPKGIDIENLIDTHTCLAAQALENIPPSEARNTLLSLLDPSAPQPS